MPASASGDAAVTAAESDRSAIDLCPVAFITARPDGTVASWNPAAQQIFGHSAQEIVGRPLTVLIPQRDRQRFRRAFARHTADPSAATFHRSLVGKALRKDDTEIPVEVCIGVGCRDSRQVFTALVRDLTDQHAILDRLNDALQRLQFHVERMPLAYIVWNKEFCAEDWNPAAVRIFGYTRAEALGRSAWELVVPDEAVDQVHQVWRDLLEGDSSSHSVNANRRKDGTRLICEWFNTPLRDSRGAIRGVASMAMDITEREIMEEQIRNTQKLESLGVLAGGVAHDFNSSLTVILGNAELLRAIKGLPEKARPLVDLIDDAAMRADQLIKHLLAYARTGRHNPQPLDLNCVIRESARFIRSSLGPAHELRLSLADSVSRVRADSGQLEQVLLNLCLNARQAQPNSGVIELTTREVELNEKQLNRCVPHGGKSGRYVELEVRDEGCGMDPATLKRIFDPFFTTKADGHGLGLAAVHGILRQHSAVAYVETRPGHGTRFHVYLPVPSSPSYAGPAQDCGTQ